MHRLRINFCSRIQFYILNAVGKASPLTIRLMYGGGDLGEVDTVLEAVVMMFRGRSQVALPEQKRCGDNSHNVSYETAPTPLIRLFALQSTLYCSYTERRIKGSP